MTDDTKWDSHIFPLSGKKTKKQQVDNSIYFLASEALKRLKGYIFSEDGDNQDVHKGKFFLYFVNMLNDDGGCALGFTKTSKKWDHKELKTQFVDYVNPTNSYGPFSINEYECTFGVEEGKKEFKNIGLSMNQLSAWQLPSRNNSKTQYDFTQVEPFTREGFKYVLF